MLGSARGLGTIWTMGGEAVTHRLNPTGAGLYTERHQAERRNQPNTAKQHNCLGRMVMDSRFGN
jgi:hypothetical protein